MRYATIGTSWITGSFIEGAIIAGNMQLGAVYSRNEKNGKEFSEKFGCVPVYTDLLKLAECPSIDAVYIASPNVFHYEQSKLFLLHGKHVICEKPATVTSAQLIELITLAKQKGLVYIEAIMMRYLPARTLLHKAIGQIGDITTARFDFSQLSSKFSELSAGRLPNIFNPAMSTGCLMDLGIYCVYAAIDLFGRPDSIAARAGFLKCGADGYGSAIFDYPDKQLTLTYSKIGQSVRGSEIMGTKGTITIDSVSKLTGITLIRNIDNIEESRLLIGDIPKPQLMSHEAAAFFRFAQNPRGFADEIDEEGRITLAVCETMEDMRRRCGIRFADDIK
ncbi:MAG: Gfo/Idh/MocA family oxidoreductase [Oscillospiraceae bacterium]|nr:Gfo/Idh/MocA family oxidoreductase [Oscillospiraceae bacterium]MDD4413924.1 Gfo/Idh/MocA family oxidoreductase [Oscillospiraceae bacterium]